MGWYEVVGMVRDVGRQMPEPMEQAAMYHPSLLQPGTNVSVAVRVHDPIGFGSAVVALKIEFGSVTQVLMPIVAGLVMLIAGLVACALPLRRALSINATDALRAEA